MRQRGFGLIEVIIGTSLILIFFVSVLGAITAGHELNERNLRRTRAAFLLNEGVEATKMLRAEGWTSRIGPLASGTDYFLAWNGTAWQLGTTLTLVDSLFERRLTLSPAYRDINQDLAESGTSDPDTRLLQVTVSWLERGATTTVTTSTYLTNLFDN